MSPDLRNFRRIPSIMRSFGVRTLFTGLLAASVAAAHARATPPGGAVPALPDPAGAVGAFFAARAWLDAGASSPEPVPTPADVRSAGVVLRFGGRVFGRGEDAGGPSQAGRDPLDRALRAAWDAARARVAEIASEGGARPLPSQLTLEVELAGPRVPLIGRTFADVLAPIEPAECGLMVVDGDRVAYMTASEVLARRMAAPPFRSVMAMLTELSLPARDLPELQAIGGATAVYGAWGMRLAQRAPDASPEAVSRLVPVVPVRPMGRAAASDVARSIVERTARLLAPPPAPESVPPDAIEAMRRAGLRGTYLVNADIHEPAVAPAAEQAFMAWALARAAATAGWPRPLRDSAAASARALCAVLEDPGSPAFAADDALACAFTVLAAADLEPAATAKLPVAARGVLRRLGDAERAALRPSDRAVVLDAACALAGMPGAAVDAGAIADAVEKEWESAPAAQLPSVAPSLIDAERRLRTLGAARSRPARADDALDAARTVLAGTQVLPGPGRVPSLDDEFGAFPVVGSAGGRVSSQSLRPLALFAMRSAECADRDAGRALADRETIGWAVRFARQLTAGPGIDAIAPNPEAARGGVLASPCDASMPVGAQALALWTLAEVEAALERLEAPSRP